MKKLRPSKVAIMVCILRTLEKYQATFCWPTLDTMLYELAKYHRIEITIRTLKLHLMELRDMGFIISYRRYGVREDGTLYNKPSNRQLTLKALKFLKALGIRVADWLWKWAIKGILPFKRKKLRPESMPAMNQIRTGGGTASLRDIIQNLVPACRPPAL